MQLTFFRRAAATTCCALLLAGLLTGCTAAGKSVHTATFAIEADRCISDSGETIECAAPYVLDGVGYAHLQSVLGALGLEPHDGALSLDGEGYTLPETDADGFLPVSALLSALPFGCAKRGGVFLLSTDFAAPAMTDEAYASACLTLGYDGYDDRAVAPTPVLCVDPYQRYTYEQMREDVDELCATYPTLAAQFTFGESVEGRELVALSLGRGSRVILCTASLHACEFFSTNFVMYMADQYAYGYATNGEIDGMSCRELLDKVRFLIVPMVNPDGVNIAQNGPDAAADPDFIRSVDMQGATYYSWKANANGVDLNRNFPLDWRQENYLTHPAARYFCGNEAAIEPEVQAMMRLMENTPFCMAFDFHTYGEKIYWIDTNTQDHAQRYAGIAERLCDVTGYYDFGMEDVSKFGGYLLNYARETYDVFSAVVELCYAPRFAEDLFDLCAADVYPVGLAMAEEAAKFDDDEPAGRFFSLNGAALALPENQRAADGELTLDQLRSLLAACGFETNSDGQALTVTASNDEALVFPYGDLSDVALPVRGQNRETLDARAVFAALGIGWSLDPDSGSLRLNYWR